MLQQPVVMTHWRIGCSGYHYTEWKGLFYPPDLAKSKWFEYYTQHFNTIELNVTFYRFPRVPFLKNWFNRCPENFNFSVKAPRLITHYKRFKDAQRLLADFYGAVKEGLGSKLGCVLFQFPATFAYEHDHLERIVSLLDKSFINVVEFRHLSWWQEKVYQAFSANNISFCGMSHPGLPEETVKTSDTLYYRFHGVPHLYVSAYETQQLDLFASEVRRLNPSQEVYLFFNNTAEGAAVRNAKQLLEIGEAVLR
jgi:uncharacterized protein YecE (DUF72 family)